MDPWCFSSPFASYGMLLEIEGESQIHLFFRKIDHRFRVIWPWKLLWFGRRIRLDGFSLGIGVPPNMGASVDVKLDNAHQVHDRHCDLSVECLIYGKTVVELNYCPTCPARLRPARPPTGRERHLWHHWIYERSRGRPVSVERSKQVCDGISAHLRHCCG
jgi:hypothetical protein